MAVIVFKNNTKLFVPQDVLDVLHKRVISEAGAKRWQGMVNERDEVIYLINMDEICYIENTNEKP